MTDMLEGSVGSQVDQLATEYGKFTTEECIGQYLTMLQELPKKISALSEKLREGRSLQKPGEEEKALLSKELAKVLLDVQADLTILLALNEAGFARGFRAEKS